MIRTEKYNFSEQTDTSVSVEERSRRRDFNTRFVNATNKASRERPSVKQITRDSFSVMGSEDEYFLRIYTSDDQTFIHCTCDAGTYNQPCYHALAVLLFRAISPVKSIFRPELVRTPKQELPATSIVFTLEAGQPMPIFSDKVRVTVETL